MKQDMDVKLEKMQFLGTFGILQEAHNIIYTWRKIFSQITLFFIFPLSLFYLAHQHIFNRLLQNFVSEIIRSKAENFPTKFVKLSDVVLSYQSAYLSLFNFAYAFFLSILSLPSSAAIAYVVSRIYVGGGEVSLKQSLKVVTKVWKRVLVTSFYSFAFFFTYSSVAACVLLLVFRVFGHINASILIAFMVMFFVGSLYFNTIWMLSRVVCVLDESYGFKALMKSQRLLRGKMGPASMLVFLMSLCAGMVQFLYNKVVVRGVVLGMMGKSILGILCLVLLIHLFLLKVVVETVLYFVCKSYHHENIDMSNLTGLVEVYVSLKTNDVQLETERLLV